ncbi:FkbM family methyltransferase [Brachyspira hyodysenteriae]|uniref:FkbM family methyltransferase n=1 Tax=Brachyspira hyodysenteriae TaxID=159 RepID=UPI0022CDE7E4|nr:FkbM family methyltransferase [Brachyspira hyodysenteriae]MDA0080861.1 FkbM family methyltransferase [Brachyspira hyodysenteriae]
MDINTVNRIVWWIPFRHLRDGIREYLMHTIDIENNVINIKERIYNDITNTKERTYAVNDLKFIEIFMLEDFLSNKNDLLNKYRKLINGLDSESIDVVNNIVSSISLNNMYFTNEEIIVKDVLLKKHLNKIIRINDECYIYDNKYILNINAFSFPNFYDRLGLDYIQNLDFIKDKAIIDAGAWKGDTAVLLSHYTQNKVYAFDPLYTNYIEIQKNIELNNINNVEPVNMALGEENKKIYIDITETEMISTRTNLEIDNNKIETEMITLDKFVEDNNIKVGLIKTDLEGFEQPFLRGALNTIKKQKPILIISIYHNYNDFFDIKPMIEELNLGYKFKIAKSNDFELIRETKTNS